MPGDRQVKAVQRPFLHVFPDLERGVLILREVRKLRASRPGACSDLRRRKPVGMVQRDVPRPFTAHRKSPEHHPLLVDFEALLHGCDAFEHIRLAGPVPARAVDASEQVELDLPLVGHRRIAGPRILLVEDELGFRGVVLPPVHPHVEPRGLGRIVTLRKRHRVRLHRAIDGRIVGVDLLLPRIPLRLVFLQLPRALDPLIEYRQGVVHRILRGDQLRKFE